MKGTLINDSYKIDVKADLFALFYMTYHTLMLLDNKVNPDAKWNKDAFEFEKEKQRKLLALYDEFEVTFCTRGRSKFLYVDIERIIVDMLISDKTINKVLHVLPGKIRIPNNFKVVREDAVVDDKDRALFSALINKLIAGSVIHEKVVLLDPFFENRKDKVIESFNTTNQKEYNVLLSTLITSTTPKLKDLKDIQTISNSFKSILSTSVKSFEELMRLSGNI